METTILEKNKRIAIFFSDEPEVLKHDLKKAGTVEAMHYHDDLDHIMPVFEQIGNLGYKISLVIDEMFTECSIIAYHESLRTYTVVGEASTIAKTIFLAVFLFVERETAIKLWGELGDVPTNEDDEIDIDFDAEGTIFKKGTDRQEIWHWFEERFDLSVATDLMGV